jgi:DNA-binding NarL/FixJ family response regulator
VAIAPSKSGFLLYDTSFNLIASNPEAVQILSYPTSPNGIKQLNIFLSDRIRSTLLKHHSRGASGTVKEYLSGKRRYTCRQFQLNYNGGSSLQPATALLLERNPTADVALEEICRQFDLTPREREIVELLVQGLTTKEIANRLAISPNTVKAFVRLVMVKMSVSTRSGIVGRLTSSRMP